MHSLTMSTGTPGLMHLVLLYSNKKYNIRLDANQGTPSGSIQGAGKSTDSEESTLQGSRGLTVGHLVSEVAKQTDVSGPNQRLIHKGKSLTDANKLLSEYGIKDRDKVMLVGRSDNPVEAEHLRSLEVFEKRINATCKKVTDIQVEFEDLKKGYLEKRLAVDYLRTLTKRIGGTVEEYMVILDDIDGYAITNEYSQLRQRKKLSVRKIQALLDEADRLALVMGDHVVE